MAWSASIADVVNPPLPKASTRKGAGLSCRQSRGIESDGGLTVTSWNHSAVCYISPLSHCFRFKTGPGRVHPGLVKAKPLSVQCLVAARREGGGAQGRSQDWQCGGLTTWQQASWLASRSSVFSRSSKELQASVMIAFPRMGDVFRC